jgi:glycosyltransferase involved in cell wall biosynthesis
MRLVLVLNLPYIINKNLNQVLALKNYHFLFITKEKKIQDSQCPGNCQQKPIKNPFVRLFFCMLFLFRNRKKIHHVEIYPGGKLTFVFVRLVKLFRCKAIVAERGDIGCMENYSRFTQWSMERSYQWADIVWFREPFMEAELKKRGVRNLFFQGNAISIPKISKIESDKEYDFFWANRLIPERNIRWVLDILNTQYFVKFKTVIIGIQKEPSDTQIKEEQEFLNANKPKKSLIKGFVDPCLFYRKSKFFIFPAEKTFANFSLLESMSYGVVPIISDVPGTEKIVRDGENGIVCEFTKDGLEKGMKRAMELSESEYEQLSSNAIKTIEEYFSLESYANNMRKFYKSLNK